MYLHTCEIGICSTKSNSYEIKRTSVQRTQKSASKCWTRAQRFIVSRGCRRGWSTAPNLVKPTSTLCPPNDQSHAPADRHCPPRAYYNNIMHVIVTPTQRVRRRYCSTRTSRTARTCTAGRRSWSLRRRRTAGRRPSSGRPPRRPRRRPRRWSNAAATTYGYSAASTSTTWR